MMNMMNEMEVQPMTKRGFLLALRCELQAAYGTGWAAIPGRLDRFMDSARETIETTATTCNLTDSNCAKLAWRSIGGKGPVTYKNLRSLI